MVEIPTRTFARKFWQKCAGRGSTSVAASGAVRSGTTNTNWMRLILWFVDSRVPPLETSALALALQLSPRPHVFRFLSASSLLKTRFENIRRLMASSISSPMRHRTAKPFVVFAGFASQSLLDGLNHRRPKTCANVQRSLRVTQRRYVSPVRALSTLRSAACWCRPTAV